MTLGILIKKKHQHNPHSVNVKLTGGEMPIRFVHGQRTPRRPFIGWFTRDFQTIIRDKVPFRVRALAYQRSAIKTQPLFHTITTHRPFLIILCPPAPEILLRIRTDKLAYPSNMTVSVSSYLNTPKGSPIRHPDEVLVHRDRHPAPADRPQRVPRSEVQGDDGGTMVRVEDHIRGMRSIARGAPIAEPHTLVDIDKLGAGELPALVFEEDGYTVLCRHGWCEDPPQALPRIICTRNFKEAKPNGG